MSCLGVRLSGTSGRAALCLFSASLLAGCVPAGAPAIPFFGAYFPSWLLCALVGILGAVIVRLVFIRLGIDDALPARLPVYVCLAAGIGFLLSLVSFGR
ncbi:YtcA family lipoprotein [Xanthobacter autotrophicus]|uniref:YtcA family lipoprotein n=1 Tax=Xanthobacter autotrophicus TaxID=280 RepID=UPI00372B94D9